MEHMWVDGAEGVADGVEGAREGPRLRVKLPGVLEGPGREPVPVQVVDLGFTGGTIEHPDCLTPGDVSILTVRVNGIPLRLKARLRWSYVTKVVGTVDRAGDTRIRSRVDFLPLSQSTEVVLKKYLDKPDAAGRD